MSQHHYFASTYAAWFTAPTREKAIRGALVRSGKTLVKEGIDVQSVRVPLPQKSSYQIRNALPVVDGISEYELHHAKSMTGKLTVLQHS